MDDEVSTHDTMKLAGYTNVASKHTQNTLVIYIFPPVTIDSLCPRRAVHILELRHYQSQLY